MIDKYEKDKMLYYVDILVKAIQDVKKYKVDETAGIWEIPDKKAKIFKPKKRKISIFGALIMYLSSGVVEDGNVLDYCWNIYSADPDKYFVFKAICESLNNLTERGIDFYSIGVCSARSSDEINFTFLDCFVNESKSVFYNLKEYKKVIELV